MVMAAKKDKKRNRLIMRTSILFILVVVIAFTIYNGLTKEKNELLQVGDWAPDFALTDLNGNGISCLSTKGRGCS